MNPLGGLRETGGLPLFSPEGRTYSPPRRHKLHILRPAASGRSHPFRCASFSHKVLRLCGSPFAAVVSTAWLVRSPRGIAAVATASRQCHSPCLCCCHCLCRRQNTTTVVLVGVGCFIPPCRLPAQTCHRQLYRSYDRHFNRRSFSFTAAKETKTGTRRLSPKGSLFQ